MTAPSFRAVSPKGEVAADYDQLREENASLKAERSELYRQLDQRFEIAARVDELKAERADLAERLAKAGRANARLAAQLAQYRAAVTA